MSRIVSSTSAEGCTPPSTDRMIDARANCKIQAAFFGKIVKIPPMRLQGAAFRCPPPRTKPALLYLHLYLPYRLPFGFQEAENSFDASVSSSHAESTIQPLLAIRRTSAAIFLSPDRAAARAVDGPGGPYMPTGGARWAVSAAGGAACKVALGKYSQGETRWGNQRSASEGELP